MMFKSKTMEESIKLKVGKLIFYSEYVDDLDFLKDLKGI